LPKQHGRFGVVWSMCQRGSGSDRAAGCRQAASSSPASANFESCKTQSSGSKGAPGMAGDKCSLRISHSIPAASNRLRTSPISALFGEENSSFIMLQSCCHRALRASYHRHSKTRQPNRAALRQLAARSSLGVICMGSAGENDAKQANRADSGQWRNLF
jgi:hypothetical protein